MNDRGLKTQKRPGNALIDTLKSVHGNQRACLFTEPLYAIPFNLFIPFTAIYMAALGLSPFQIGIVATLNMASQMVSALFGGVLADKLVRRRAVITFDMLCWVLPHLIWSFAQNASWFYVAALLNGMWRISNVSFSSLLVEEADRDRLVHMYALLNISGLISGFVSPLSFFLVRRFSVVPTLRVVYFFAFAMMLLKNAILYYKTHETSVAIRRKKETGHINVFARLWDSRGLLKTMLQSEKIRLAIGIMACTLVVKNVTDNFWPLFVTDKLLLPDETLSLFNTVRSLSMLLCTLFLIPRMSVRRFKRPLLAAFSIYIVVDVMYLLLPQGAFAFLVLGTFMEAFALSIIIPMSSSIEASVLDDEERARMLSFSAMLCMLFTAPFGMVAGWLSRIDRALPIALNACILLLAIYLTLRLHKVQESAYKLS